MYKRLLEKRNVNFCSQSNNLAWQLHRPITLRQKFSHILKQKWEFLLGHIRLDQLSTDIFKDHVWEDWNIPISLYSIENIFQNFDWVNGYFNAVQCKLMFRSSHFWFFGFGHFWRPSYKDTKILHNLCLHIPRQDGEDGENRKNTHK